MKTLPIGIENFKELIDKDCYYVDKTKLILNTYNEKLVLFTRPRRFGKTLNMSMLYYFYSNKEIDNAYLFHNLEVSQDQEVMKHQNQYPTIFITLKDMKRNKIELQIEKFASIIADLAKQYNELLISPNLNEFEKGLVNQYLNRTASENDLMDALYNISNYLKRHYHKKVIILIDEYDVPLQSAYTNNYYDEMVDFLRSVFSAALKTNDALEKGVMTGCLRIAKESIFTGLNNFNVYSIMNEYMSDTFGFVSQEVKQILNDYQLIEYYDDVKEWYDAYLFGNTEIYNPWSVLKYVQKAVTEKPVPESFWASTSGNELVVSYIKNADDMMYDEFEQLMQGKPVTKYLELNLTYNEMDNQDNIYSFLLLTGYLKVNRKVDYQTYELVIPKREVYEIYRQSFMKYFKAYTSIKKHDLINALLEEKETEAERIMNDILFKDNSYYDNNESFYHGFLIGLLDMYGVESNQETGEGRADIVIKPRREDRKSIVFECKHSSTEKDILADSIAGAKQIKDRKYLEGIKEREHKEAVGYGIAFYKKRCKLTIAK